MECPQCGGKGGYRQVVSYFPDGEPDVAWDQCSECDGTGNVNEKESFEYACDFCDCYFSVDVPFDADVRKACNDCATELVN